MSKLIQCMQTVWKSGLNEPDHERLWYLSHRRPVKAQVSLGIRTTAFAIRTHKLWKQMKDQTKTQTASPTGWRLKNEFTEDEKYHNLMRWLKYWIRREL